MQQLDKFYLSLIKFAYSEAPHGPHITRYQMYRSLKDRLANEDSPEKRAVVVSGSEYLARLLGLHRAHKLLLAYPEYTLENLALLSNEYDFVISDQVLEHCRNPHEVASETMRVLKPGGCFVHTTCFINVVHAAPYDFWRFTPAALGAMFPQASEATADGWGNRVATVLMESGFRMLGVPENPKNPINEIATHREQDWPVTTWVVGRKTPNPEPIVASVITRKAPPQSYSLRIETARFGVVTCVRNEAPYLLEWIAHYRVLGFQQITIYDNESNDGTADILGPLSDAGAINAIYWRSKQGENKQVSAYNDALARLRGKVEWCAFLDLDEFLVLDAGLTIADILSPDPEVAAIGLPWRIFGSDGQRHRQLGLTIERFIKSAAINNEHVKCLVRLENAGFMNVHVPQLKSGRIADLSGDEITYESRGKLERVTDGPARINHYFCRSWEEFECKRLRGRGAVSPGQSDEFRSSDVFRTMNVNEVEDTRALPMVPEVNKEVARLRKLLRK